MARACCGHSPAEVASQMTSEPFSRGAKLWARKQWRRGPLWANWDLSVPFASVDFLRWLAG
jgi:hypothetical protein